MWEFSVEEEQFVNTNKQAIDLPKDVFASAAKHPCLQRSIRTAFEEEPRKSSIFQILRPEPECKRMHDWFAKVGMPTYLEHIQGFELPFEPILKSTEAYGSLMQSMGDHWNKERLQSQMWGNEIPRTFRLWKVS